jgi:hypothetical protein
MHLATIAVSSGTRRRVVRGLGGASAHIYQVLLLAYVLYRAASLSLVHDEAITVIRHARRSLLGLYFSFVLIEDNNHLLNTYLVKLCTELLGYDELVIRIPALVGAVLFATACLVLAKRLFRNNPIWVLVAQIAATANPLVVDFMGLARGYGMALGLCLWGVEFFFRWRDGECRRLRPLVMTQLLLLLACFASYSVVYLYFTLWPLCVLLGLTKRIRRALGWGQRAASASVLVGSALLFFLLIFWRLVALKRFVGGSFFGGKEGFLHDTIGSLVAGTFYHQPYQDYLFGSGELLALALFACALLFWLLVLLGGASLRHRHFEYLVVCSLLLVPVLSILLYRKLDPRTLFPMDRAVLYFIPLLCFSVCYLFATAADCVGQWRRVLVVVTGAVLFCGTAGHYLRCLNVDHTFVWSYDMYTDRVFEKVVALEEASGKSRRIGVGVNWLFEPSFNFYRMKYATDWIAPVDRSEPRPGKDYYYVTEAMGILQEADLTVVDRYPIPGGGTAVLAVPNGSPQPSSSARARPVPKPDRLGPL